jgi:DNA-directed RNA polymerase subunit beta
MTTSNSDFFVRGIVRKSFARVPEVTPLPNLIELQKRSFEEFLQANVPPEKRKNAGLQAIFKSALPINSYDGKSSLEFVSYRLEKPKYDVNEAIRRNASYMAGLRVIFRLVIWDIDPDSGAKEVSNVKEQEVSLGDIPLMRDNATFIVGGIERVVVSQMHRAPGVFFDHDHGKSHASGKYLYTARIIPYRGAWIDMEFDIKDLLYFRIDKKRKLPISSLLLAMGMSAKEMYEYFYKKIVLTRKENGWVAPFNPDRLKGTKLSRDLINADTNEVVAKAGTRINVRILAVCEAKGLKNVLVAPDELLEKFSADQVIKGEEIILDYGDEITPEVLTKLNAANIKRLSVLDMDMGASPAIRNTIKADKNKTIEEATVDVFHMVRPGEPTTYEAAKNMFQSTFFDSSRYDLSAVGRLKINSRLDLHTPEEHTTLTHEDILSTIKYLVRVKEGLGEIDEIDSLANRRIRAVGELLENQFRLAFVRIERNALDRMSVVDIDAMMPHELINSKLLISSIKEFFGTSQLSQFMDQTNPLSEITHKRRVSALGPGGLTRDRAGLEVRDVHTTHYGRICPVETPEGQNIGLINSLASYARVNKYGFIESPYRKVVDGKVTNEVVYLSAMDESKCIIAQSSAKIDKHGNFVDSLVSCRKNGNFIVAPSKDVNYVDVAPMQVVSIAASLIPFLENDDAKRALMGANMQKQAVPLIVAQAPFVGTGIERFVAQDSGATVVAVRDGVIDKVDSGRIVLKYEADTEGAPGVDIYGLKKFQKSNHNTCINQKPLVKVGDSVKAGEVIADGPSTERGELALGRNVLVAFMSWYGCNFEDSIVISEALVREDAFTSIHIEEFSAVARDTRLGPEEITRDIPNVSEEALLDLDEAGIIRVGAQVKAGDILVGKVTPKTETPMTPEEKLLLAIFGEKAADVKDSSLHVPPGITGTVIEIRVFSRRGIEKDQRAQALEHMQIQKLIQDRDDEINIINDFVYSNVKSIMRGQAMKSGLKGVKTGTVLTDDHLEDAGNSGLWNIVLKDAGLMKKVFLLKEKYDSSAAAIHEKYKSKIEKIQMGDDLPQGVLKEVKVFVAMKYKLQPGDKMAGRHGNKGVISKIVPQEDMPFLEDGTRVDIVLNPLGVPPRMNFGQILETHLGWASVKLGQKIAKMLEQKAAIAPKAATLRKFLLTLYTEGEMNKLLKKTTDTDLIKIAQKLAKGIYFASPVFDGAKLEDINQMLQLSDLDESGQVKLIDGRTGEYFSRKITIGYIYMLKLHHLVDDKLHARSVGPYSLVTQQPLGGKSHFGGQRFGEMECWALQGYGAAYTLQEMLTVKSDDVIGRVKMFESIVRGDNSFECSTPESFNVMLKELRSLCLNVELKVSESL